MYGETIEELKTGENDGYKGVEGFPLGVTNNFVDLFRSGALLFAIKLHIFEVLPGGGVLPVLQFFGTLFCPMQ